MTNKKNGIKINDSFFLLAFRNCGYDNYSAIADIIDNSLEPEVNPSYVKVDFETEGSGKDREIKSILVIDNGNGMSSDVLEEAMALGSDTGKNPTDNLGMYGTGMKAAAFSIGKKLQVFTKIDGGDVNYAVMSLEDTPYVEYKTFGDGSEEYKKFKSTVNAEHGTIVKISHIDKLSNKSYQSFKGTLKNKISEIFNKFIYYEDVVKLYVCKDEVPYTDLIGNGTVGADMMGENSFNIEGHDVSFKAWYIPKDATEKRGDDHYKDDDGKEYTPRTLNNQGLYIYRQNRLVGKALTLGLWTKDQYKNGFRCEVFVDGSCDHLFGSNFTKTISEKSKGTMSQSLIDKLSAEINPYVTESAKRDKKDINNRKENDPEAQKKIKEFYKRVTDKQNKNMMLKANRKGANKPKEDDKKEHEKRGKQTNPNPVKNRVNKWLDGFEERPMGRTGEMHGMEHSNGRRIIIINTDHPFYQKFYSQLNEDLKFTMAQIISCDEIAKQNVNYYSADDIQNIIDKYNEYQASEVGKSLTF